MVSQRVQVENGTISANEASPDPGNRSYQMALVGVCLEALKRQNLPRLSQLSSSASELSCTALLILLELLQGPYSDRLAKLELELDCLARLTGTQLKYLDAALQIHLLNVTFAALKLRILQVAHHPTEMDVRQSAQDNTGSLKLSYHGELDETTFPTVPALPLAQLLRALRSGLSAPEARSTVKQWIQFLIDCLPLFGREIYQVLIPMTELLCREVRDAFDSLRAAFVGSTTQSGPSPDHAILSLLEGLEQMLATAHDQLVADQLKEGALKSPENRQGFFGSMFSADSSLPRTPTANDRLTVILSFQDAVRICYTIWSFGNLKEPTTQYLNFSKLSLKYSTHRLRSKARKMLEHLFRAEPLECLEALIGLWRHREDDSSRNEPTSFDLFAALLHVLDGSQPRTTLPVIFKSLYTRTNPGALESSEASSMTVNLRATDIISFMLVYVSTLEDDAVNEVWIDSLTFLRDISANYLPHRSILPGLVRFAAILSQKLGNTTFGDQKKYRRDISVRPINSTLCDSMS